MSIPLERSKLLSLLVLSWFIVSCSGSDNATTRGEQEMEFTRMFGFNPPAELTTIKYYELWNRGAVGGGLGQWVCFTYTSDVFERIQKAGFTARKTMLLDVPNKDTAPDWWEKVPDKSVVIYSRTQDDTAENKGFKFEEYLWHDASKKVVYYHKYSHD